MCREILSTCLANLQDQVAILTDKVKVRSKSKHRLRTPSCPSQPSPTAGPLNLYDLLRASESTRNRCVRALVDQYRHLATGLPVPRELPVPRMRLSVQFREGETGKMAGGLEEGDGGGRTDDGDGRDEQGHGGLENEEDEAGRECDGSNETDRRGGSCVDKGKRAVSPGPCFERPPSPPLTPTKVRHGIGSGRGWSWFVAKGYV